MEPYAAVLGRVGQRARTLRLLRGLQQRELAQRASIGLGTVVRFEQTGRASIEYVLRIATVLGADEGFERLFETPKYRSLDDALGTKRQRVRRKRKAS